MDLTGREMFGCTNVRAVSRLGELTVHRATRAGEQVALIAGGTADDGFVRAYRAIGRGDAYVVDGVRAVVRPWFPGSSLHMEKRPLLTALAMLEPVATELARLHGLGHADRALSRARLVVEEHAVLVDAPLAAIGLVPHDPLFAAPEQLDARSGDARSDVYALALLFLEVASGKPAYGDIASTELYARAHDRQARPSLRALGVAASARVEAVLARALSVDPELRFADAAAFWKDLKGAIIATPIEEIAIERPTVKEPVRNERPTVARAPMSVVVPATILLVGAGLGVESVVKRVVRARAVATASAPPAGAPASASASASAIAIASASASASAIASASALVVVDSPVMMPVPSDAPVLFVDRTEVTVGAFRKCVKAGVCQETPKRGPGWSESDPVRSEWLCNYHRKGREEHPINCVSFAQATAYCGFVGKRVPSGDEWKRAAGEAKYPWGDSLPRCNDVVYARYGPDNWGCKKHPVGTEPIGRGKSASPFGVEDLAGSLWEWTTDTSHGLAVLRGGAWDSPESGVTSDSRLEQHPGNADVTLGFRCVRDP